MERKGKKPNQKMKNLNNLCNKAKQHIIAPILTLLFFEYVLLIILLQWPHFFLPFLPICSAPSLPPA